MSYKRPIPQEFTVTDKYGEERTIHQAPNGRLAVKRTEVTPALALNQELSALVGDRIKRLRLARGFSLEDLCLQAGLRSATPKQRMWEIENAGRNQGTRLGTIYAIAIALGVEATELMPSVTEVVSVESRRKVLDRVEVAA